MSGFLTQRALTRMWDRAATLRANGQPLKARRLARAFWRSVSNTLTSPTALRDWKRYRAGLKRERRAARKAVA